MWHPWVGARFGLTPADMADLSLSQYVSLRDALRQEE
jgi:hypothetical protein